MAAAMDVDTPSGTNSDEGKKRFEVKKWNAVALWVWDIVVDYCAICRTTSWIFALNVRSTRHLLPLKSVLSHGESVIMLFISTASLDGSKRGRCVRWTTESENSKNMGTRKDSP
ncbi:E3 ubiquitin-protein ligase RBX1 isoform X2 [Sigmodon hispidus]